MKEIKVIDRLQIGNNTSIIVNGSDIGIKIGMYILDSNQNKYKVLSVGMTNNIHTTMLLIEGNFQSNKIYVEKQ